MNRYIIDYSLKNGLGKPAISIYLMGCDNPIKCEGCHNQELQQQSNEEINLESLKTQIDKAINNYLNFHDKLSIAILGGEPLTEYNRETTLEISKYIKEKYNNSTVILYSWRTIELIKTDLMSYINYIDYGVLGAYKKDLYIPDTLPSSINQYIYDFKNNKKLQSIRLKRG